MLNDLIYILKELRDKLLSSRLLVVAILYSTLVFILFCKLFNLQIINGETYQKDYVAKTEKTVALPATRGNIYDVNGNLLAYNKLAYAVTIQDNGYFEKDNELNLMIYNLVRLLHNNDEKVIGSLEIGLDDGGNFYYTGNNENAKKRFLKDLYQLKSVDELDNPNGKYKSTLSAAEVIDNRVKAYKLDKLVDENENSISLTDKEKLDIINIRYTMILTGYKKYEPTKVASAISETTKVTILENMSLADKKGEKFGLKKLINIRNIGRYKEMLKELDLGLEDKLTTKVKFLSGGQRQSLSLCMATMKRPKILLLDEHTAALDPKTSTVIMEKTRELIERKKITTIMISHNMRDAIKYSDRVIMLDQGKIILDKQSKQLSEKELTDIYTEKLNIFNEKRNV